MFRVSTVAAALLLVAHASAQCLYIPDNRATTGGCNVIPFGTVKSSTTWVNQKYQTIYSAAALGGKPLKICELGFAACAAGIRKFDRLVIKMDHVQAATLSTTFASNLSNNAVTVLDTRDYVWPHNQNQWNRIGLQKTFQYLPPLGNLVIEILTMGCDFTATSGTSAGFHTAVQADGLQRVYAFSWSTTPPPTGGTDWAALKIEICSDKADLSLFGAGCPGSNSKTPALSLSGSSIIGNTTTIALANGPATRPTILVLGFMNAAPIFPVDLTVAGAPGCSLYQSLDATGVVVTDGSGNAKIGLPIPNDSGLTCARVYVQWLPYDQAANKLGLTASNYGRILVGTQ